MNTIADYMTEYDDVFVHEENDPQTVDSEGFPYAQDMSQRGGGIFTRSRP